MLPSEKNLRIQIPHRDWSQEMKCKKPRLGDHVCTPTQTLSGATLPPDFSITQRNKFCFSLCQKFYNRIHLNYIMPQLSLLIPLPFFVVSKIIHPLDPIRSLPHPINKLLPWAKRTLSSLWVPIALESFVTDPLLYCISFFLDTYAISL